MPCAACCYSGGRYYFEKFGITPHHVDIHDRLQAAYVEGLIWCLAYYYRGCVSWGWFFPFHYVPMISDLVSAVDVFAQQKEHDLLDDLDPLCCSDNNDRQNMIC